MEEEGRRLREKERKRGRSMKRKGTRLKKIEVRWREKKEGEEE